MKTASWISLALGAAGAAAGLGAYAVNGRSSSLLAPSVWHGPREHPTYALTFDDGPSESTPRLLDLLDFHGVKATFFLLGANVRRLPGIAREILLRGHEVGNHGDRHPYYCFQAPRFVYSDIVFGQREIEDALGFSPWLFRPPFGLRWPGMREAQRDCGLVGVQWSVMGRDWRLGANGIAQRLADGVEPGAILCLHDGRELAVDPDIHHTITAVRAFLLHRATEELKPVTVSALFAPELFLEAEALAGVPEAR
ncbi:MAG: polysaccharide deacetylase family protein [Bryobacterales bacterium]|nr:polysaccharide deacetylase family protein [Bryobacterales bacterium]